MSIKIRRGLDTARVLITPDEGEFLYDTNTKLVYIGDNSTLGGNLVGGVGVVVTASDTDTIDLDITSNNLTALLKYQPTSDITFGDNTSGLFANLTTTGVVANTYGDGSNIPQITVDSKGRITGVTNIPIVIPPTLALETDGTPNGDQTLLNLVSGTNITLTDNLTGSVTIAASGGGIPHGTATGTDTYSVTITGITSLSDGDAFLIRFTNGNTGTSTLNISSTGAKTLYRNNDGPLIGGDIWAGAEMLCVYNLGTNAYQCIGTSPNSLFSYVTNDDSVSITKGQPVYAFSGTGDRMTVKRALNTSDATSAQTVGIVFSSSIGVNQKGFIIMQGLLDGLSILPTSTYSDGDAIYLGATAGSITNIKPYAPNHLVYLGVVTTANNGSAGRMYVRIQNGYELDEIHDVDLISVAPTNGQVLQYVTGTPDLWKPRSIFGQMFIEFNGLGGVIQPSYTGVSNVTYDGTITGWTIFSQNPSTAAALSGSIDVDIWIAAAGVVPTVADTIFPVVGNRPKLTTQSYNSATGLSIAITQGQTIMARVITATTCVLVNLQLQITRT